MKRIMVTGVTGFIGRNLAEYLPSKGFEVFSPRHKDLDLLDDSAVKRYVESNRIDIIIHGANVGGTRKQTADNVVGNNLRMFHNVMRCQPLVERIIHFGSGAEFDRRHYIPRMSEDYFDSYVPADDYGFSKYCMTKYIEDHDGIVMLRLFGVFGRYEDYEFKFISNSMVKNLLHCPIRIQQNVFFDYLYVDDLLKIVEKFISIQLGHHSYNVCTGSTVDLVTLAKEINKISDFNSDIEIVNPGLNVEYSGNNERMLSELGAFNFTPRTKSMSDLLAYYRSILHTIDQEKIIADPYAAKCSIRK